MVDKQTILLINPACQDKRVTDQDDKVIPIGLFYIGALLIENGFNVQILNLAETEDPVQTFKTYIQKLPVSMIGFSVTNPSRLNAIDCANVSKKLLPDVPIVFGGPAATFLADHLFNTCPALDYIITGEGEITFLELATALEKKDPFDQIPGIVFKKDQRLVKTIPRPPIQDLDSLPHPSKYFAFTHLAMSRGCPGKCTFCGSPKFWTDKTVRFHSPEWMVDEIEILVQKGIRHFYISDDTFTMDKDRVISFCRLIQKRNLSITWNAISRVDYIDEDLALEMRLAGCIQISFGVESGSKKIRKTLGKPIDREKIIQAFEIITSHGILPRAYFIYGSPGETDQTIQDSIDLLLEIKPLTAVFYMLVIFPGTYLYDQALKKDLVKEQIWSEKIEDLPWFELDSDLNFEMVKQFGDTLRSAFYSNLETFARDIQLADIEQLYPYHADFLSRLALTFSHGEYATDARIKNPEQTAIGLFEKALSFYPDARSYLGLGMIHQKNRDFKTAVNILEKGLSHFQDNPDLLTCMGICQMNIKNFKDALNWFKKLAPSAQTDHYINICKQHI